MSTDWSSVEYKKQQSIKKKNLLNIVKWNESLTQRISLTKKTAADQAVSKYHIASECYILI